MNAGKRPRTHEEMWEDALAWVKRTRWPTRMRDEAIADRVYTEWIEATNARWLAIGERDPDGEDQYRRLHDAFIAAGHDEEGADNLYILMVPLFELRARREGRAVRRRVQ